MNVGETGAKTGAATSDGGMMTTFDEFDEFWEMRRGDQILLRGPRYVADSGADVCSRQATRLVLMRLIGWAVESSIAGGSGWSTFRTCVIPLAHQRPGRGFRQRLDRGACFLRALGGGMPVVGFHRRMAEPGTQLLQRREAVLDVPEGRGPLVLRGGYASSSAVQV